MVIRLQGRLEAHLIGISESAACRVAWISSINFTEISIRDEDIARPASRYPIQRGSVLATIRATAGDFLVPDGMGGLCRLAIHLFLR
jgi:hypothetical protein